MSCLQNLGQEILKPGVLGIGEELLRGILFFDDSFVDKEDAGSHFSGKSHLVRDDCHRHARFRQLLHNFQNFADHFGVESGGGLVEEEHVRIHGQRADDRDTLFLSAGEACGIAAGEACGIGVSLVEKADTRQQALCFRVRLFLLHVAGAHGSQSDVPADRHVGEEVKVLEDHSHLSADRVDIGILVGEICSLENDMAAGRHFQKVQAAQESGFSRARRADDDDLLALADILCDAVEDDIVPK